MLLKKYMAKEDSFNALARTIEEAQEYAGVKGRDFTAMVSDLENMAK